MKPYLMEFLGTFFLTVAVSFTGNPLAIGLMLAAMIYIGSHVSGGHYNPAVSLSACMRGKLKSNDMFFYIGAQTVGATIALFLFRIITGNNFPLDTNPELPLWISVLMETLLTSVFCLVIATVTSAQGLKDNTIYGMAIGLTLTAIAFVGGVFNPAIAFSSILFSLSRAGAIEATAYTSNIAQILAPAAIYLGGPCLGGALAALTYDYLNNPN